jgi:hypothetical protein
MTAPRMVSLIRGRLPTAHRPGLRHVKRGSTSRAAALPAPGSHPGATQRVQGAAVVYSLPAGTTVKPALPGGCQRNWISAPALYSWYYTTML